MPYGKCLCHMPPHQWPLPAWPPRYDITPLQKQILSYHFIAIKNQIKRAKEKKKQWENWDRKWLQLWQMKQWQLRLLLLLSLMKGESDMTWKTNFLNLVSSWFDFFFFFLILLVFICYMYYKWSLNLILFKLASNHHVEISELSTIKHINWTYI